ncbi:enoyl-[acyl-carrier-protein] reductase FabK [Sporomusa sp. KB1]|uniref:enoyl-[acyl-carrier-protein] reductase FabK n=1 Tax=Sporomusa sp. KB1 TaxID=943346 RepID=UPI0011A83FAF|nr:enoyl-[acyl-carrier-protein] reductase FabK [Sporomusa sp. KB1]TWH48425.1 enoyl-[acyl-carrier protein] reductase II [Sporomusa sp. KB1]
MLNNKICQLLNIKYPILQGGMAWVATAELAAAVSNAGGLGIIGAGHMPPDALKAEIVKAKNLTNKPFGVNIMLMSPFVKEVMQVVIEERVAVVTTGAGNPGEYIPALKAVGTKIIPVVASVALAKRLERVGIDAIIAEGMESGGHVGEVTTMALVPLVADAVTVPVIAAGGIGDARGVVAALALGAQGVQMGTVFAASTECTAHPNYKAAIIKAKERATVVTGAITGHPVRVIANKLTRDFAELEKCGASTAELERLGAGKLKAAVRDGDVDYGSVMIGQVAGMITTIRPVNEIMQDIVQHIPEVMTELSQTI